MNLELGGEIAISWIEIDQQTIGNRLSLIKKEYPELLEKYKFVQDSTNLVQAKVDKEFVF